MMSGPSLRRPCFALLATFLLLLSLSPTLTTARTTRGRLHSRLAALQPNSTSKSSTTSTTTSSSSSSRLHPNDEHNDKLKALFAEAEQPTSLDQVLKTAMELVKEHLPSADVRPRHETSVVREQAPERSPDEPEKPANAPLPGTTSSNSTEAVKVDKSGEPKNPQEALKNEMSGKVVNVSFDKYVAGSDGTNLDGDHDDFPVSFAVFKRFDVDRDGRLNFKEFKAIMMFIDDDYADRRPGVSNTTYKVHIVADSPLEQPLYVEFVSPTGEISREHQLTTRVARGSNDYTVEATDVHFVASMRLRLRVPLPEDQAWNVTRVSVRLHHHIVTSMSPFLLMGSRHVALAAEPHHLDDSPVLQALGQNLDDDWTRNHYRLYQDHLADFQEWVDEHIERQRQHNLDMQAEADGKNETLRRLQRELDERRNEQQAEAAEDVQAARDMIRHAGPCASKPCTEGFRCVAEPKECITTPCPQFRCVPIGDHEPPSNHTGEPEPTELPGNHTDDAAAGAEEESAGASVPLNSTEAVQARNDTERKLDLFDDDLDDFDGAGALDEDSGEDRTAGGAGSGESDVSESPEERRRRRMMAMRDWYRKQEDIKRREEQEHVNAAEAAEHKRLDEEHAKQEQAQNELGALSGRDEAAAPSHPLDPSQIAAVDRDMDQDIKSNLTSNSTRLERLEAAKNASAQSNSTSQKITETDPLQNDFHHLLKHMQGMEWAGERPPSDITGRSYSEPWDYNKNGTDWPGTCASGERQSPIYLSKKNVRVGDGLVTPGDADLVLKYTPAAANELVIANDGNTVRVAANGKLGSALLGRNKVPYHVREIIFRTPSEHTFENGPRNGHFDMEMQIVHRRDHYLGLSGGDSEDILVLSILFFVGEENAWLNEALDWKHLGELKPRFKSHTLGHVLDLTKADGKVMWHSPFFSYLGSITTPPCTESAIWKVMATPLSMSKKQLQLIQSVHNNNNRQVQPLGQRSGGVIISL